MDSALNRIKHTAQGRWPEIFAAAGMDPGHFVKSNRPCPLCGGRDRFSLLKGERNEPDGRWYCRGCGYGDGIELVKRFRGSTFPQTLRWLEAYLGIEHQRESFCHRPEGLSEAEKTVRRRERNLAFWNAAVPLRDLSRESPQWKYLASRGLGACDASAMLRAEAETEAWETNEDGERRSAGRYPVLLAAVTDGSGGIITLHRTFLTPDGGKAPLSSPKKLAPGAIEDGLIRLFPPTAILCLAEGIETALSVHEMTGLPVWSAISLTGLRKFGEVPEGVKKIHICGDNDRSYAGAAGAYELAARIRRSRPDIEVAVHIPPEPGTDWNDVLRSGGRLEIR
ncbi:toprim domain-containing protein [Sutterella seckii]|uniref:Toprim domain-containing protein n=1 Tax=Sutterella seckii TaxID=1944635 RepID=A0A6I1ES56_9BURK|nr:toprim domain-containing protein [Sutterella seckii]KAB7662221.1 hypothetical protein GBM95_03195 [Sutterella seckii]MBS5216701.1 toprim domain-containing protein [Sutterella wadsworthensis]